MQVHLPLSANRLEELCYSDLTATEAERNAVVESLLQALYQLESSVDIGSDVRKVVEGGGGDWMGQYMIKREYSEGSYHVFGIIVPDLRASHSALHQPADPSFSEGACQSNVAHRGSDHVGAASDPSSSGSTAEAGKEAVDEAANEAGDEAVNADDAAAAGKNAELANADGAQGSETCAGKEHPASKAASFMHKAQALVRPLIPQSIAQLKSVARLLGTGGGSSSSNIQQPGFCPAGSHHPAFEEMLTGSSRATPVKAVMHLSMASESVATVRHLLQNHY